MDAAKIAATLSPAQREDFSQCEETFGGEIRFWSRDLRTAKAILRKGLVSGLDYKNAGPLTPLGIEVFNIITQIKEV